MPEISDEELAKFKEQGERALALEASKKRLEDENSKIKSRAKDAEDKLSVSEKAKLESEGKTQELLDKERSERMSLEEKYKSRTSDVLREKLRTEISRHAKDAHDIDMLLRVNDHKDILKLDEEALTVDGAKEYVEKVRETHKYLFSNKSLPNTDNKTPGKGNDDDFKSEDEKYLSELKQCSTKKELNAIKKKYGKQLEY